MRHAMGQTGNKAKNSNDLVGVIGEAPDHLPCDVVEAVCRKVSIIKYKPCRDPKLVFEMWVYAPEQYAGVMLRMFVRLDPRWKTLPVGSKLWKMAQVAAGPLKRRQRVTKSMFEGKAFRCRLRSVGKGPAAYSVVDSLIEKLTE